MSPVNVIKYNGVFTLPNTEADTDTKTGKELSVNLC